MRKNNKIIKTWLVLLFVVLNFAFFVPVNIFDVSAEKGSLSSAKSMVVLESSTGRILYSSNEHLCLPMASTTKIITAIYVIEHCENLDKIIKIPKEAEGISGTSIGLKEGEHLSIRELLYGLMLRSGNDCAVALAIETSGSVQNFANDVNSFLKSLGLRETHIVNPHGLSEKEHYTSASDLAFISAYAMKNETFKEIVSTKEKRISNELESKYNRNLKNKNKLLSTFNGADGVKTGFTISAGRCFVGSATRNGMQLICVLLNCVPMFEDCSNLLEKGFREFSMCKILEKGRKYFVFDGNEKLEFVSDKDFSLPLTEKEKQDISLKFVLQNQAKNDKEKMFGEICAQVYLEKQLIFSHKIYIINNIENNGSVEDNLQKIFQKM